MIEIYKKHVTLERFLHDGNSFQRINRSDYLSYREFIEYFRSINIITKHNLIIGINFTYGWMPIIFEFCSSKFDESLEILNNAKKGTIPKIKELKILRGLFNNSLVGSSKLLHFINPEIFAIWDSRVYRYLTGNESYDYRINDYEAYLSYLAFCNCLTNLPEYEVIHNSIIKIIGYSMAEFRTAELIMYSAGGTKRNPIEMNN